jgi:uncharacterized protein (TIGR02145 family)
MLNVSKLLVFALAVVMLSCADYKELNLEPIPSENIIDNRDGTEKIYKTVIIGDQVWMAENLNYWGENKNIGICYGDSIQSNSSSSSSNTENCEKKYGRLYTWVESVKIEESCKSKTCSNIISADHRGICPSGWHLPSEEDWMKLYSYIGYNGAVKLKNVSGWSVNGTNEYGFSAVAAGFYLNDFQELGSCGAWWSSKENGPLIVFGFELCKANEVILAENFAKQSWASVRCVKD